MKIEVNIENCSTNAELFGKRLCEELGWKLIPKTSVCYYAHSFFGEPSASPVEFLSEYLDSIAEAEKAVIERVGEEIYGQFLFDTVFGYRHDEYDSVSYSTFSQIATADTKTRLVALLLALGINEIKSYANPKITASR